MTEKGMVEMTEEISPCAALSRDDKLGEVEMAEEISPCAMLSRDDREERWMVV